MVAAEMPFRSDARALLDGSACFAGDLPQPELLHLAFVASPFAHARIDAIDTAAAASAPGVVAVFTAVDLPTVPIHEIDLIPQELAQPALADGEVRFAGEYVAAVVAESAADAVDAAELVLIDAAPLPAVIEARAAGEVALSWDAPASPTAFGEAAMTVRAQFVIPRVAVAPMEGRAILAVPEPDGRLTLWASTQSPHWTRAQLARSLDLPFERLRVITPYVGGGFGGKAVGGVAAYVVTAAAALLLRRPVRFVEDRRANLVGMQGRGLSFATALHARRDGTIVALEVDELCDAGAYPTTGSVEPGKTSLMACGPYRVPTVAFHARSVRTNLAPTGAYRGPGRAEAAAVLERSLDLLARDLEIDPAEVRRRNLLSAAELPRTTPTGAHYDDGDFPALLDAVLAHAGYEELRAEQGRRRARGDTRVLGIGLATVLDSTAWFARRETALVSALRDGTVRVVSGTTSAGQEHARAFAASVAEVLPVSIDDVVVVEGDTDMLAESGGTSGSRSLQLAGSAVRGAAEDVLEQARRLAATMLEAAVDDVVVAHGRFCVRGVPARGFALAALAACADGNGDPLDARCTFEQPDATYTGGAHVSVVEVDVETGAVVVLRHVAVTDCGRVVDPPSAEGQVLGASAQGIAQAVFEEHVYDADGNPLTTSFADYLLPAASELPSVDAHFLTTAATRNPLGARGVGEVGMVAAPSAVHSAVLDALAHLGVRHVDMPCTPERVWLALREAGTSTSAHE
jgi:aerobic carbon-monoxide dehydrogenase large subunit